MPFNRGQTSRMFSRPNVDLARKFMGGPQQPNSQYANQYPNMVPFSRTPAGQEIMTRVMRNMQARRGQARPVAQPQKRRPAALEGNR